jgi:hypothetical protein
MIVDQREAQAQANMERYEQRRAWCRDHDHRHAANATCSFFDQPRPGPDASTTAKSDILDHPDTTGTGAGRGGPAAREQFPESPDRNGKKDRSGR